MLGEHALKLIRDVKREPLGVYNLETVSKVQQETMEYFGEHLHIEQKFKGLNGDAPPAEFALFNIAAAVVKRNLRCLLAYHHHRMNYLVDFVIQNRAAGAGKVPAPKHLREKMSTHEQSFYMEVSNLVHRYKSNFDDIVDVTGNMIPPQSTFIQVRVLRDLDFETEDGCKKRLLKGHTDYLKRSHVEKYIEQGDKKVLWQIAFMGVSFSLIYTGFNVAQSYVTTIYTGSAGFIILTLLSAVFSLSALFASAIHNKLKYILKNRVEKITIAFCSFGYFAFVLFLNIGSYALMLIIAVIAGLLGGQFWANQGIYLTKVSPPSILGTSTGLFFTLHNTSGIIGYTIALVLLTYQISLTTLLWVMASVSLAGCIFLIFLPPVKPAVVVDTPKEEMKGDTSDENPSVPETSPAKSESGLKVFWKFLKDKRTLQLLPTILVQGIHQSFTFGSFPLFIAYATLDSTASVATTTDSATNIAISFLLYSIGLFIGSYVWGKLFDYFNRRVLQLILFHVLFVATTFPLLIAAVLTKSSKGVGIVFAVGIIFGLNDSLVNAIVNQTTSTIYTPKESPLAFSWYWCVFCVGYSIASLSSGYLPPPSNFADPTFSGFDKYGWLLIPILNVFFMLLSSISACILDAKTIKSSLQKVHPAPH